MGELHQFRPRRAAPRGGFRAHAGFVGLGALVVAVLLHQSGLLPTTFSVRQPNFGAGASIDRHTGIRAGDRLIKMSVRTNARAIDGDSLRADGEEIRLRGIDAPEFLQTCRDTRGRTWACGREAHATLRSLVARGEVSCGGSEKDRYGRTLARCSAGDVADLGETMVRLGFALDFLDGGYRSAEAEARAAKRGIWAGEFEPPRAYRRRHPRTAHAR